MKENRRLNPDIINGIASYLCLLENELVKILCDINDVCYDCVESIHENENISKVLSELSINHAKLISDAAALSLRVVIQIHGQEYDLESR